ncbi:hypothetical protein AYO21_03336 [Fonsecaea monophora]|uniref:Zn(2)-C6 fungal-type domain-containing protein n=1 Tax=Fonsecaea monophora TaxID=254056 RepID=A0A177FFT0_9EURO|nr:hypothetical protein AYO21_03336 [Fonsecaea monophora]OAG42460.1 hypothetical protein AYO21_03336 [Fonsecaea monophora]
MNGVGISLSKRKACMQCAKAKAKCSFTSGLHACDRCRRLRRDCLHEEAPRRQKEKQSTRIKALEEKVSSLLTLLTQDKQALGNTNAPVTIATPPHTEEGTSDNVSSASIGNVQNIEAPATSTAEETGQFDVIDSGVLTMATADILLQTYKQVHSKFFPFVLVAPEIDAATLRRDKPVLFLAIVTVCLEADHVVQRRLGVELKKMLSSRLLIRNERSIELLQALLVHLSWIQYHFHPQNKQTYMLLQMAIGLVMDLDLDRCPAHRDQRRTTAETRALLGCFYLCSSLAMTRKELLMSHTRWIDHCCDVLQVEQEAATDIDATAFVRTKCLAQRISERFSYGDHASIRSQSDVVIEMSLNGFKKEISDLEANPAFSSARENLDILMAELKVLSITMYEVALYRDLSSTTSPSMNKVSQLWNLLASTRAFVDYFLSVPEDALRHLPAAFFSFAAYALIVLSTVSRLPSTSGWDSAIAKHEADVLNLARRVKVKFGDELTRTGNSVGTDHRDVWAFFARGMGGLIAWHERCEKESQGSTAVASATATAAAGGGEGEEPDYELRISRPDHTLTARCAMADVMTPFNTLRFLKPDAGPNRITPESEKSENGTQPTPQGHHIMTDPGVNPGTGTDHDVNAHTAADLGPSNDAVDGLWDDEVWQSIMDEFSMFPTTTGFPAGSSVSHQVERLRW